MKQFIIRISYILLWQIAFFLVIFGDIWQYFSGSDDFVLFVSLDGNGALFADFVKHVFSPLCVNSY